MSKHRPIVGYRTMTAAQRHNARQDRIWEDAREVQTRFNASSRDDTPATTGVQADHYVINLDESESRAYRTNSDRRASLQSEAAQQARSRQCVVYIRSSDDQNLWHESPPTTGVHTATPWRVGRGARIEQDKVDAGEFESRRIIADMTHSERAEADAAFIVRAVNSHDKLVAALREVQDYLHGESCDHGDDLPVDPDNCLNCLVNETLTEVSQ